MSTQIKTIKDIQDIAVAFIKDEKTVLDILHETYGITYKFTRRGLANFPYVLELSDYGLAGGMIIMYRGTTPGTRDKRALFKNIFINKSKDTNKNVYEMQRLLETARLRAKNIIYATDNTKLLGEKLQDLMQNSR